MKIGIFVLFIVLSCTSEQNQNDAKSEKGIWESSAEVFEEDEFIKRNEKTSKYVGVTFYGSHSNWRAIRWSKNDYTMAYSGPYKDEETAAHASDTLARKLMKNGEHGHELNFPDDLTEVWPEEMKTSEYIGVSYNKKYERWHAQRRSKNGKKMVSNGHYKDEEIAAHASDTLARKLMASGEYGHKLNFPDDYYEMLKKEMKPSAKCIGVSYSKRDERWHAQRYSKNENIMICNGKYKDEETAAHASDTLARKLMASGEHGHKLNFPDDPTEVWPDETKPSSKYIGVSYNKREKKWRVQRGSKNSNKVFLNGYYKNEDAAAHASDTLARRLMTSGEHGHKLNFPDDYTQVWPEMKTSEYIGVSYNKKYERWHAQRYSKNENKVVSNGHYKDEETAAHASDTLARKLMASKGRGYKLNFPEDDTEVWPEHQRNKRKRSDREHLGYSQNK